MNDFLNIEQCSDGMESIPGHHLRILEVRRAIFGCRIDKQGRRRRCLKRENQRWPFQPHLILKKLLEGNYVRVVNVLCFFRFF